MNRTTKLTTIAALLAMLLLAGIGSAQASAINLVTNGDFEAGTSLAPHTWGQFGALTGWSRPSSGPLFEVQYALSSTGPNNNNPTKYVELDSTGNYAMSQLVSLTHGATYTLSFDYLNRTGTSSSNMNVSVGSYTYSVNNLATPGGWTNIVQQFVYSGDTSSLVALTLLGTGCSDSLGAYVDNVSLTQTAPTPIPGAVWLLGSGLLGVMGFKRTRRTEQA